MQFLLVENSNNLQVYSKDNSVDRKVDRQLKTKFGYPFSFKDDKWRLDGSSVINFNSLTSMDDELRDGFKSTLCRYAEELSAGHTLNCFKYFNAFMKANNERHITVQSLSNYRASLNTDNEYRLGMLKGFLLAWNEWGFKGVNNEVASYLKELTLKGSPKGNAVKGACPYSGPLTLNELGSLIDWASNAFNNKELILKEYACFMVLALTGRRFVQIRSLRSQDLMNHEGENGYDYIINCPRAKQIRANFRSQFTPLPINEDLYLILNNQRNASIKLVEKHLGFKISSRVKDQIPIFLEEIRLEEVVDEEDLENKLENIPDYLHMSQRTGLSLLKGTSVKSRAYSERTGDFINFTAYRFRYTKGTNLARRGITGVALAAGLDHSDTQHIGMYVENTEERAKQIDAVMAPILAPLAQAFAGKLIASERDAVRANDPNSRIKNGISESIGSCGTHSFCASGYRACYTCINFQPWVEAPHENVLEEVLFERKRQEESGVSPYVIQSTDRLLLAIQQVILMCGEKKLKEKIVSG